MFKTILKSISVRLSRICARHGSSVGTKCAQVSTLDNEVKVATQVVDSPLACVTVAVAAGPRYETSYTNGLTHFIEHLALKGCRSYTKEELEKVLLDLCAKITVHTSREQQVFSVILPSENASCVVDKLCSIITELDINDYKIRQERENICRELADTDADPKQVVFDYLNATAFQGTPLAQRVIGSSENINRFDADITSTFMCENYMPFRLCLATVGKVDHKEILTAALSSFGNIELVPTSKPELGPNRFTGSQVLYRDDSMPFCHAVIAVEAPGYTSADYYKMQVLNYIVGSWDRSQGRDLGQAPPVARWVAIDKLCERYEPFYTVYRDIGLWGVYFIADKWKLDEIVARVQDQWMQLCTVVTATDVERGCRLARLNAARKYDSVVWSAHDLGKNMLYTCGRNNLDMVNASLTGLGVQELKALADRYLYDRCPAVAVVGPSETMPDYVRIRSGMWWLRL